MFPQFIDRRCHPEGCLYLLILLHKFHHIPFQIVDLAFMFQHSYHMIFLLFSTLTIH